MSLFRPRDAFRLSFSTGGGGETVSGLAPYFPCGAGKSCLYCKTQKQTERKRWWRGGKGRAQPRGRASPAAPYTGVSAFRARSLSSSLLGSHAPGGCPAARALHRPEAPVGAGKAGAGRPTSRQPPPAAPAEVAPRRRDPACGPRAASQLPSQGPRSPPPRRLRGCPWGGGGGRRPEPSLSGFPSPSSSSGRRPRPRLPRPSRRPRPRRPHQRPSPPSAFPALRYRRSGPPLRGSA